MYLVIFSVIGKLNVLIMQASWASMKASARLRLKYMLVNYNKMNINWKQ